MKSLSVLFFLAASVGWAQQPIVDVATGTRCTAVFFPTAGASEVQIDCVIATKPAVSTKMAIGAGSPLIGLTSGLVLSFTNNIDSVTFLLKRASATAQLSIDVAVNGVAQPTKLVTVP
jgi:hypothetical protein